VARPALAATRALDIIAFLSEHSDETYTMAQLVRALGLNQGSAHAVLTALAERGFVERHPAHKTFRLGPVLVAIGEAASKGNPVIGLARDELSRLAKRLELEALAMMRSGRSLLVVVQVGRPSAGGRALRLGKLYPLIPPLGAVLTTWSSPEAQHAWLAAGSGGDKVEVQERLERLLGTIRATGYQVMGASEARLALGHAASELAGHTGDEDREAELLLRVEQVTEEDPFDWSISGDVPFRPSSVAVPVRNPAGTAVLELAVHGFAGPVHAEELRSVVGQMRDAATVIETQTWGRTTDG
jgi:DNA-binding IclR family transcriptional regulator